MSYTVALDPAADRDLESIPARERNRITRKIVSLASDPRPIGVKKLRGKAKRWRVRAGDYRIVYDIRDDLQVIHVIRVRHRSKGYSR